MRLFLANNKWADIGRNICTFATAGCVILVTLAFLYKLSAIRSAPPGSYVPIGLGPLHFADVAKDARIDGIHLHGTLHSGIIVAFAALCMFDVALWLWLGCRRN